MTENWQTDGILVTLGALFLVGLAADMLGRRTRLPRVTLLLICGLAVGKSGFDLIPAEVRALYDVVAVVALTMVAFLLGGDLRLPALRAHGPAILVISLSVVIGTFAAVTLGLWAVDVPLAAALVLGPSPRRRILPCSIRAPHRPIPIPPRPPFLIRSVRHM